MHVECVSAAQMSPSKNANSSSSASFSFFADTFAGSAFFPNFGVILVFFVCCVDGVEASDRFLFPGEADGVAGFTAKDTTAFWTGLFLMAFSELAFGECCATAL